MATDVQATSLPPIEDVVPVQEQPVEETDEQRRSREWREKYEARAAFVRARRFRIRAAVYARLADPKQSVSGEQVADLVARQILHQSLAEVVTDAIEAFGDDGYDLGQVFAAYAQQVKLAVEDVLAEAQAYRQA